MPKIALTPPPARYVTLCAESAKLAETRDCSVIAATLVIGDDYANVRDGLARYGRKERKGMDAYDMRSYIRGRGLLLVPVKASVFIKTYPGAHKLATCVTTHHPARFPKVWKNGRTFLFFTSNHVLAVIDGEALDWSKNHSKRVTEIYEVIRPKRTEFIK